MIFDIGESKVVISKKEMRIKQIEGIYYLFEVYKLL
jgi:hypothetical protein